VKLELSKISKIYLYGSFADLTYNSSSDVDLLTIFNGDTKYNVKAIQELEDYFGKEVNFIRYNDIDFFKLLKEKNKFANNVFEKGIKIYDTLISDKLLI